MVSVSFFGATGGCTLAALTHTLRANIDAVALARTPSKLLKLLAERGIPESVISKHLTIIQGNAKDVSSVSKALVTPKDQNRLTDVIVFGIGGTPSLRFAWYPVDLDDPRVCADSSHAVATALKELRKSGAAGEPIVTVVSTTGISNRRDVPLAYYGLYHWLLAVPHADKRLMEKEFVDLTAEKSSPIKGFVSVRPTLLQDGPGLGVDKIRVGWESTEEAAPGPALGYFIAREDVGAWIFENIVVSEQRDQWAGRMVSLAN